MTRASYIRMAIVPVLCWILSTVPASAQEAMIRTSLEAGNSVWVGQRVTLAVELLVPGYFASAVSFDLPDPAGVLLMPPAGRPLLSNETIGGTLYTVQRHEVSAWPMRAGEVTIPALAVRFSFKRNPLDTQAVPGLVETKPVLLKVELPPGAGNLGTVISARDLKVEESWRPEPGDGNVTAGAAFTRTVRFTAPDVPGMIFPPFPAGNVDGLGIYPKQRLLDRQDRGSLVGVRRDEITYVCQRPGVFTVPAVRFTWFDLDEKRLRTEELPARTLKVIANPAMVSAATEAASGVFRAAAAWRWLAAGLAAVLLMTATLWAGRRGLIAHWIAPFRPVHLEPLNPPRLTSRRAPPVRD